jgi:hypothetical protein
MAAFSDILIENYVSIGPYRLMDGRDFEEKPFSIFSTHRPRRIAFLVDPTSVSTAVLKAVIDFNIDCWNGRYNPLIPVTNGAVCADYWPLLDLADPDIVYTFTDLDESTIDRLDTELGPISIEHHQQRQDERVYIGIRDQATTKGLLTSLTDRARRQSLGENVSVLNFDYGNPNDLSECVHWNFGVSRFPYFIARDHGLSITQPKDRSDTGVVDCVANTRHLIVPIHISRDGPSPSLAWLADYNDQIFTIFVGRRSWDVLHYWNNAYFSAYGNLFAGDFSEFWLPELPETNSALYNSLKNFIHRRVFTSGNYQRRLVVVSTEGDVERLRDFTEKLCRALHGQFAPGNSRLLEQGRLPEFKIAPRGNWSNRQSAKHHHVRGRKVFIDLDVPVDIDPNAEADAWMMDLAIEAADQESAYSNLDLWWSFPRRGALAGLFDRERASRINRRGRVSFQVAASDQNVTLIIPSDLTVFRFLLMPEIQYCGSSDLRHQRSRSSPIDIRIGDKGRYLNGILGLHGSVKDAVYFCEHPFWRDIFHGLCCTDVNEQVTSKIRKDLRKGLDTFCSERAGDCDAAVMRLAEIVLQAAQKIPQSIHTITFADLERKYGTYLESLKSDVAKDVSKDINLKEQLSGLTQSRVLQQGSEIRCVNCLSSFWYHIDDLREDVTCQGCRSNVAIPAENIWSYRPNELIRAAFRYQGLLPVIRTIGRLFDEVRSGFIFAAGLEFLNYETEEVEQEVDLCWIKDSQFGIAEIKKSSHEFSNRDCEKLIKLALHCRPNIVMLAATNGEDGYISTKADYIRSRLPNVQIQTLTPTDFKSTPFHYLM